ncbi:MAG: hypothetical protein IJR07_09000 [Bacteroidaceae bacterium]|nr:hypothetical protein [Bacteroidaceae bacterium]
MWEDDATRLAYDVGSFHLHTIIDFEAIPDARHDDRADVLMTRNGYEKTAYSDYLYAAEDDMGFTMSRQEWEKYSPNNVYWYGRAKDGLWLEPRILIDYKWVRLPYLEVNVVVLVQLKGKDAPVLLSRTYLPAMKKYDAEEFKASVQKAKNYENMKQYDYQMQRIKDYMTLFKLEYPVK